METRKLSFAETFRDVFAIGVKNAPSIVAAVALWLLTIWIPYLNVGTTIAVTLLPTRLAEGGVISPFSIFDSKYRRYMGEYFITMGLMWLPILVGMLFMIVPAVVLSLSWSLAYYFLFERGKNPLEAIKASNDATYGSKWTMLGVAVVFGAAVSVAGGLLSGLCSLLGVEWVTFVAMLVYVVLVASMGMAVNASFWRQLKDNAA